MATAPLPTPASTPQVATYCQVVVMKAESPVETDISSRARVTVLRRPNEFISAAAKGPVRPYRKIPMPAASEIDARSQPNAFSSGRISTPGAARRPAAAKRARKMAPATMKA